MNVAAKRRLRVAVSAVVLLTTLCWLSPAFGSSIGQKRRLGVGIAGGMLANGLSVKYYIKPRLSLHAVGGLSIYTPGKAVSIDLVREFGPRWRAGNNAGWWWGLGIGGGGFIKSGIAPVVSGILQGGWHLRRLPIELTTDYRPTWHNGKLVAVIFTAGLRFFL